MITRLTLLLSIAGAFAFAQPDAGKMTAASVAVYGAVGQGDQREPKTRGGGILVDAHHVVTYLDTCCGRTEDGKQLEPVVVVPGKKGASPAKVVWSSEALLLAILEVSDALEAPGLSIAPVKFSQQGQPVFTVQMPDPDDKDPKTKMTEGKIQDIVKLSGDIQAYKTTAPMIRANSGGALFDSCGNVIGVNLGFKGGVQTALVIDPLLAGLQGVGVQPSVADHPCASSAGGVGKGGEKKEAEQPSEWRLPKGKEWIPVILLLAVVGMAFRRGTRQQVVRALTGRRQAVADPAPYPYPPAPLGTNPTLCGLVGQYAGESMPLDGGPSILGRDQHIANLVFPPQADSISKRHCTIRWDVARKVFVLEDLGSTNGTFLASGEKLIPGQPRDLRPGDRFYIGDLRNQFEVRMEE
jgi:hypothetical protein